MIVVVEDGGEVAVADAPMPIVKVTCTMEFVGPEDLVLAYLLSHEPCDGEVVGTAVRGVVKSMKNVQMMEVG